MLKKDSVRVTVWGITVEIVANVHIIYLKGYDLTEARNIIIKDNKIPDKVVRNSLTILKFAQECNANLLEVRSCAKQQVIRFSFEFEFWEEFLKFKKKIEELSQ